MNSFWRGTIHVSVEDSSLSDPGARVRASGIVHSGSGLRVRIGRRSRLGDERGDRRPRRRRTGEAAPGVTLTLRGSGPARTTTSELDGSFRFEELAPATYRLDYSLAGEASGSRVVVVGEDAPASIDVVFRPGFLEEVTVTATREERSMRETPSHRRFRGSERARRDPSHPPQPNPLPHPRSVGVGHGR